MRISLCMIVKDEDVNIKECLDRALEVVDEAMIVDTGSTDSTLEILNSYDSEKVRIIQQNWNNDFSEARNKSIETAMGDYILILDADERIFCDREKLEEFLLANDGLAYKIPIYNIFENKEMQVTAEMIRIYKNKNPLYIGAIHEQITFDGKKNMGIVIDENICKIYHFGYSKKVFTDKDKQKRNMDIITSEIEKNPKDAFNWYNKGVMEMIAEDFDTALEDFIKSHKLTKGSRMAFHNDLIIKMIQCLLMQKKYQKVIEFTSSLLKDLYINTLPDLYYYLGLAYKELQKYKMAEKNFLKALKIGDATQKNSKYGIGSYMPLVELARIEIKTQHNDRAIEKYKEAILHKNNINKYGLEEYRQFLIGIHREELINEIENEIKGKTINKNISNELKIDNYKEKFIDNIQKLIESNMIKEAKELINEYEKIFKKDIKVYAIKGILAMMQGDFEFAELHFLQGLEVNKTNFDLLFNLAYLYQSINNENKAIEYYKRSLANASNQKLELEVYNILTGFGIKDSKNKIKNDFKSKEIVKSDKSGNYNEFEEFKIKIKQNMRDLIEEGKIEEGKVLLDKYEEIVSNDIDVYSIKGTILLIEGNSAEALEVYKQGLEIDIDNSDLLYNVSYLYEIQNCYLEAYRYLIKLVNLNNDLMFEEIVNKMKYFEEQEEVIDYISKHLDEYKINQLVIKMKNQIRFLKNLNDE